MIHGSPQGQGLAHGFKVSGRRSTRWTTNLSLHRKSAWSSSSSLLLASLGWSDTKVYEPQLRALLGTTSHFCEMFVLEPRTVPKYTTLSLGILRVIRRESRGASVIDRPSVLLKTWNLHTLFWYQNRTPCLQATKSTGTWLDRWRPG